METPVGEWFDEGSKTTSSTMIIYKKGKKTFLKTIFVNGQTMSDEMTFKGHGKYIYTDKDAMYGEYFIIESDGTLGMYNKDGKQFRIAKRK